MTPFLCNMLNFEPGLRLRPFIEAEREFVQLQAVFTIIHCHSSAFNSHQLKSFSWHNLFARTSQRPLLADMCPCFRLSSGLVPKQIHLDWTGCG